MAKGEQSLVHRVRGVGVRSAASIDLVAVGFSRNEELACSAENMARNMMRRYRNIHGFNDASVDDLRELAGLEGFDALRCLALIELGRRAGGAGKGPIDEIADASDVYLLLDYLRGEKKEHFVAVLLDAKNHVIRTTPIHVGTLTMSLVGPREVFREAIREGACSLIVAHNHPSGDPEPSQEDVDVTAKLKTIGDMLDIPLLDHVVIGETTYVSLRDRGKL